MAYEPNDEKIEKLLEQANKLLQQRDATPSDEEKATILQAWNEVMQQAEALLAGKTPVDRGESRSA